MLPLVLAEDITALIPVDYDQSKIKKNISLDDGIVAPITKGTPVGQVTYVVDGISYTSNLLAEHDVNRSGLIKTLLIIRRQVCRPQGRRRGSGWRCTRHRRSRGRSSRRDFR